ncbi:MAG: VOC family protein [Opitutae bacterium]|nr:VOC family protein [Opitutae bacterium]
MKPRPATISPFLWFNDQAEAAAKFYVSLFKNSKIETVTRYSADSAGPGGRPGGSVMTVAFRLAGQKFTALNGGPRFKFTEAISLVVSCRTQAEIDFFWDRLARGGEKSRCGWLKDRYGLSWQIVPDILGDLLGDRDEGKSGRALQAMLKMNKLDIKALKRAHAGK